MKKIPKHTFEIINVLVREFGQEAVHEAVRRSIKNNGIDISKSRRPSKKYKPSPVELARRAFGSAENPDQFVDIAQKFEDKDFLPRISDVRNFMLMNGASEPKTTNRSAVFKDVLRVLVHLPDERLHQIRNGVVHGGPSRLGPLSEAIAEAGNRLRGTQSGTG